MGERKSAFDPFGSLGQGRGGGEVNWEWGVGRIGPAQWGSGEGWGVPLGCSWR